MNKNAMESQPAKKSAADWDEVMRNRYPGTPGLPASRSGADWDAIMRDPVITAATTMTLSNTAPLHDKKTDEQLLENMRRRAPGFKYLMSLSMADIDAGK